MVELASVAANFKVTGTHEFIVSTVMLSASQVDPTHTGPMQKGDPSLSAAIAVEQYRVKYVFLAPNDYDVSVVDIVAPAGASLTLDGAAVTQLPIAVGNSGYNVIRVALSAGVSGAHVLDATRPIGIQVVGYGSFTSYQYPGGLNLSLIAPPPPPIM